jgi:hypothetical protein
VRVTRFILSNMDTNTMIVRLVEAVLWFVALGLVIVRLDRLWLRLHHFRVDVPGWIKASVSFFREASRNGVAGPAPLWARTAVR